VFEKILRASRLLAMTAWVGGIAFFAFVVAPVAFTHLPTAHEAGLVVGASIRILHQIGLIGGGIFCLATITLWFRAEVPARVGFAIEMVLALVMLSVTAFSQYRILPAMEQDRIAAGGDIAVADITSPARVHFERLHAWSERLEGLVLLCGIGVILVLARESQWPETGKIKTI
jgi:hypothetical protein